MPVQSSQRFFGHQGFVETALPLPLKTYAGKGVVRDSVNDGIAAFLQFLKDALA